MFLTYKLYFYFKIINYINYNSTFFYSNSEFTLRFIVLY